jgi:hypothetical protein
MAQFGTGKALIGQRSGHPLGGQVHRVAFGQRLPPDGGVMARMSPDRRW